MTAPSLLLAARLAPDARERIVAMVRVMRDLEYAPCTDAHLRAAGFTDAEIEVYQPKAVGVTAGRPTPLRTIPTGRIVANVMVRGGKHHPPAHPPESRSIRRNFSSGPTQKVFSLNESDTEHMLGSTDHHAWAGIILRFYRQTQQFRYALCRNNLNESSLNGLVVHQAMQWWRVVTNANFAGLKSVPSNCLSSLRFHRALSIQPQALMDNLTSWPITAPLKRHGWRKLPPQFHADFSDAIAHRLTDGVEHNGMPEACHG